MNDYGMIIETGTLRIQRLLPARSNASGPT
ncbi:Uncharacterised protein [Serratia fonticola]|uniref:Uncharacterized protein n=1 Tax=Serratia fonticola TaxID=47917 RepID=A0A4U9UDR1_SERFO|nr:Uncharacterised protein [Serratia fonticola]